MRVNHVTPFAELDDAKELIAVRKVSPGKRSSVRSGVGTVQHLGFGMLKGQAGTPVVHVPYRCASRIVPDVFGGQIRLGVVSATPGISQSRAGKLRDLVDSPDKSHLNAGSQP